MIAAEFLRRWVWLLVVLSAPVFLLPDPNRVWLLLVMPAILILQGWAWKEALPVTPFNLPLLVLAVMVAVSLWATPNLAFSLPKIAGILFGMLLFFTAARYAETRSGWLVGLYGYILAGVGISLIGLVSTNWFTRKVTIFNSLTGGLPKALLVLPGAESGIQPNELGGALVWVIPVVLLTLLAFLRKKAWFAGPQLWTKSQHARSVLWIGLLLVAGIFTIGTWLLAQSRGAYLAIGISALVVVVLILPQKLRAIGVGLVILLGLVGVMYVRSAGWEGIVAAITDALPMSDSALSLNTISGRVEIWSRAVWAIRDASLTGLGMNSFREVVHLIYPMFSISASINLGHAHNEFLQAALDLGLPGLVAFMAMNFVAFGMVMRTIQSKGNERLLALGLGGGLLAHFIYGLTDAVSLGAKPGFLFWWLLALIYGLYRQVTQSNTPNAGYNP